MRYMSHLDVVAADAVGLIRLKTETYGDSWKRRGGPGAWFTVVRPLDRLEGIVSRHGGDIFAAIEADPTGQDGSALACVRDVMNYMILIEAHARAALGVGPHGPARRAEEPLDLAPYAWPAEEDPRPGTPDDGGHHALQPEACPQCDTPLSELTGRWERGGEAYCSQGCADRAAPPPPPVGRAPVESSVDAAEAPAPTAAPPAPLEDRVRLFRTRVLEVARELGLEAELD